jgi:7-cyano-7-deazaguanine synthase
LNEFMKKRIPYNRTKVVVLLSGGLDSSVVAALAKSCGREIVALSIDYGQSHAIELKKAKQQARLLGLKEQLSLKLPLDQIASGALVDGSRLNTKGLKTGKPSSYVSFRNGVFLALAASLAEARGAEEIWGGWCGEDFGGYPDCRADFFEAMNEAIRLGSWAGRRGKPVRIVAPLASLSKAETLKLGLSLGVDFKNTWTCYAPKRGRACQKCDACRVRARGFKAAKLMDLI